MEEFNTSIEDFVLKDNSTSRMNVLFNSTERRSLGPDAPIWNSSEIPKETFSPIKEVTPTKSRFIDPFAEDLSIYDEIKEGPISSLDIEEINATIKLQNEEQRRKKFIKEEVSKFSSKQLEHNKKLQEIYQKSLKEQQEAYRRQKIEDDKRIAHEAELQSKKSLQAYNDELEKLHEKNAKAQKDLISFAISKYYTKFRSGYEKVTILLKNTDKDNLKSMQKHNESLKTTISMFDEVIAKVKSNDIGPKELQSAELLVRNINELEVSIAKEIESINAENEAKKKESTPPPLPPVPEAVPKAAPEPFVPTVVEQAALIPATVQKPPSPPPPKEEPDSATKDKVYHQFVHPERLQFYNKIMEFYTKKVEGVKPLQADDNAKKYRGTCKRILHSYINTISSEQLQGGYDRIINFISGGRQQDVSINDHPLAKDFCLLTMAKKFVNDAETLVSSNSKSAFPLAKIVVSIWVKIPEFGQLFLAYLFKASPFLVPYNIPFEKGQSVQDYQKALGYQISAEGKVELPDAYLKRQSGIMRLYAAVMITKPRKADQNLPHPYYIEQAWVWICHMIRLEPLPDICCTLLLELLEFTGNQLIAVYGKHFGSVIIYIRDFYYPKLKLDEHGPVSRLERLISDLLKDHRIKPPEGFLNDNFW